MVWRELHPKPLTDEQIRAIYEGRETLADFELPPVRAYCWHYVVKDDRDYYVIAAVLGGKIATAMVETKDQADAVMRRVITFTTMAVLGNETIKMDDIEEELAHEVADDNL